ncbi:hypothetical protein M3Y98_00994900 [Aphelenchoides besseyi]|nr:hypothetical protein M3Y98_00994900 [Aphelenchoides besseyi]KAI6195094.1 hypothetical protein M3Y96_01194500 [Aphelenchoides besseyi]
MFDYHRYQDNKSTTSADDEELDDKFCCGLADVFTWLPIIAAFCLTIDVAMACLAVKSAVSYVFVPLILASMISLGLTVRGVKKEKRTFVKISVMITLIKAIFVTLITITVVLVFLNYDEFYRITHFQIDLILFFQLFIGLPLNLLTLALQSYCAFRAMEIIEKRDEIYVIPSAKAPVQLRPSVKLVLEKYKLQRHQLGVEIF